MRTLRRSIADEDGPRRSSLVASRLIPVVAGHVRDVHDLSARRDSGDRRDRRDRRDLRDLRDLTVAQRRPEVMLFSPIRGEPLLDEVVAWCRSAEVITVVPEDEPDPQRIDVVVVPGLAFTAGGHRLGQGGGWYDRFLARTPDRVLIVGVGFAEQVLDRLPVEAHDVPLHVVVTDAAVHRCAAR